MGKIKEFITSLTEGEFEDVSFTERDVYDFLFRAHPKDIELLQEYLNDLYLPFVTTSNREKRNIILKNIQNLLYD